MLPARWLDVPLSFGLIMAGFAGHAVFPTIYHDMEDPKEYKRMVNSTYLTVAAVYLTVAVTGYLMFGSATLQEITLNLMAVADYNQPLNRFAVCWVALNPIAKYGLTLNPVLLSWQTVLPHRFGSLASVCLTTLMLVCLVFLLPNFDRVISLLGAFFSFFISAIFPLVCHIKLFRQTMPRWELWINHLLLVLASFMAITGTIKSFI
jgi:vesicular inhibitory amino acid transporter